VGVVTQNSRTRGDDLQSSSDLWYRAQSRGDSVGRLSAELRGVTSVHSLPSEV
jgi:hypothetical protein